MKKTFLLLLCIIVSLCSAIILSCKQKKQPAEKEIAQMLLQQVDSFSVLRNALLSSVQDGSVKETQLQQLFLQARLAYIKMEWATEYFLPTVSRFVNGAPVVEVEMAGQQISEPAGLQVIEGWLFPGYDSSKKRELIQQLFKLQSACDRYKTYFANIDVLNWQVFDAAKLEVFRIMSLGITGFDSPLTKKSVLESAAALQSIKQALSYYVTQANAEDLMRKFDLAEAYLRHHTDFNTFDRALFITDYANPLTTALTNVAEKLHLPIVSYNRLLNQSAKTIFDPDAFNVNALAPDRSAFVTSEKVALGKQLFADPVLSGNGKRSCQSCHQPENAFADALNRNTVIGTSKLLRRNTPTLINAALQPAQFYDLRVKTLEEQARNVVQNTEEMHGSLNMAAKRLWQSKTYQKLFSLAFPKPARTAIDTFEIMNALSSFVRSLVFLNSRFDQYMRGNKAALTEEEINGFNLFMGKARCGTCHYMPLFNGVLPPRYMKMETEVIGVPQSLLLHKCDADLGRFAVVKHASLKYSFKTPTVRNAARTAPYMHNGVFSTLSQVIAFYNNGGGKGLGLPIQNQTLPSDKLHLSQKECNEIVAFIKALNSR